MPTKFWKRSACPDATKLMEQFQAYEATMEERLSKIEATLAQLDKDDTEMETALKAEIEAVRTLAISGSIVSEGSKDEELAASRPVFSQRRAQAMAKNANPQAMMERVIKASTPKAPKEEKEESR